jgi:hypothetical protein
MKSDYPLVISNESDGIKFEIGIKNSVIQKKQEITIALWITNMNNTETIFLKGSVFKIEIKNSLDEIIYGIIVYFPEGFQRTRPQQLELYETYGLEVKWKVEKDPYFNIDVNPGDILRIISECNLITESEKSINISDDSITMQVDNN